MPDQGRARSDDPSSSHEAAARINASRLEAMVLRIVRLYGPPIGRPLCVVEVWHYLPELSVDTISPRMKQMVRKGLLECLGKEPRANRYGNLRNQNVYMCTDRGRGDGIVHRVKSSVLAPPPNAPFASFK